MASIRSPIPANKHRHVRQRLALAGAAPPTEHRKCTARLAADWNGPADPARGTRRAVCRQPGTPHWRRCAFRLPAIGAGGCPSRCRRRAAAGWPDRRASVGRGLGRRPAADQLLTAPEREERAASHQSRPLLPPLPQTAVGLGRDNHSSPWLLAGGRGGPPHGPSVSATEQRRARTDRACCWSASGRRWRSPGHDCHTARVPAS